MNLHLNENGELISWGSYKVYIMTNNRHSKKKEKKKKKYKQTNKQKTGTQKYH